jgi:tetratricopeptide (TPR) repeat protein
MKPEQGAPEQQKGIHPRRVRQRIDYPGDAGECWALGKRFGQDGKTKLALRCFNRALRLDPDNGGYLLDLGQWLRDKGLYRQSVGILNRVLKRRSSRSALFLRGMTHSEAGRYSLAIRDFRRSIAQNDLVLFSKWELARVYHRQGSDSRALAICLDIADEYPGMVDVEENIKHSGTPIGRG